MTDDTPPQAASRVSIAQLVAASFITLATELGLAIVAYLTVILLMNRETQRA